MSPICSLISRAPLNPYRDDFKINHVYFPFSDNYLLCSNLNSTAMSFGSFTFDALPATPSNKAGFSIPSPYSTHSFLDPSADTFYFKTPLRRSPNSSTPVPSRKRGSTHRKENDLLADVLPSLNHAEPPSKKRKTVRDKLDSIFLAIKKEKLTLLYRVYCKLYEMERYLE